MDARQKLVVHEGLTQLQQMRLEMLRTVLWRLFVVPVCFILAAVLLITAIGWVIVACVSLLRVTHG